MYENSVYEMPCSRSSSRARTDSLRHHHVDAEVLADVAQEIEVADSPGTTRSCRRARAASRRNRGSARSAAPSRADVAAQILERHELALLALAARIADHAGRAADERDRLVAGALRAHQRQKRQQAADVQRIRRRIEPDVEREAAPRASSRRARDRYSGGPDRARSVPRRRTWGSHYKQFVRNWSPISRGLRDATLGDHETCRRDPRRRARRSPSVPTVTHSIPHGGITRSRTPRIAGPAQRARRREGASDQASRPSSRANDAASANVARATSSCSSPVAHPPAAAQPRRRRLLPRHRRRPPHAGVRATRSPTSSASIT